MPITPPVIPFPVALALLCLALVVGTVVAVGWARTVPMGPPRGRRPIARILASRTGRNHRPAVSESRHDAEPDARAPSHAG